MVKERESLSYNLPWGLKWGQLYSFFNLGAREGGRWRPPRGRFTPGKETWCPLCTRLIGQLGRSGPLQKISPPPTFDLRTVQPVVSMYTDYASCPGPQIVFSSNKSRVLSQRKLKNMSEEGTMFVHQSLFCVRWMNCKTLGSWFRRNF